MKPLHLFPNRQLVRNQKQFDIEVSMSMLIFKTYSAHNKAAVKVIMNKNKEQININKKH